MEIQRLPQPESPVPGEDRFPYQFPHFRLVVTHGNGPQVGFILRRNELAAHEVHPTPLDLINADTHSTKSP